MQVLYRISDNGYVKDKLPHATKKHCLLNILAQFPLEEITVFVDKVIPETQKWLNDYAKTTGLKLVPIDGGSSAQSFRIVYEHALTLPDDEVVYLLEDDYLHKDYSRKMLLEAMKYAEGAYVSLYDCPDKYMSEHCPYVNPLIGPSGGEETYVVLTSSSHWKITNSTTCTFAAQVKTLKEDYEIWKEFCFATHDQKHPNDFQCFLKLREKGRILFTPIPSLSTHAEPAWKAPLIDWSRV